MTLERTPDGVRGQNQTRGGVRAGAGRKVERYRRFAAAEVARLTRFWGPRRAAELVALAEWVNDEARGADALRDADYEAYGPSLWEHLCERAREGRAATVSSKAEASLALVELRDRASALVRMVRRGGAGPEPAPPSAQPCGCLKSEGVHVHCHICGRAWSLAEAKTRAVVPSTGPTEHPTLPTVRSYCVVRHGRVVWTTTPEPSDLGVLVCRACFDAAGDQLLEPNDPLRERARLPRVEYRLDDLLDGLVVPSAWSLRLHGPCQSEGRVYVDLFGRVHVGSETARVNAGFDAPTLVEARANLRALLHALRRRVAGRPAESSPKWSLGLVWEPTLAAVRAASQR